MEDHERFDYTYAADQRQEVEAIRKKYMPAQEDKMAQLRRLHRSASKKAQSKAITVGTVGALILGTGMSLAMTSIGEAMGVAAMPVGIVVGVLGIVLVALAYPVYDRCLQKERQKIAPQILQLTDELLQ